MDKKIIDKNFYERNRADRMEQNKEYQRKVRRLAIEALGGKCVKCKFDDFRALQIDHISGGGTKDKKTITRNYHKAVIDSFLEKENKYQLLCANCNWIKRCENNELPKRKRIIFKI